MRSILILSLVVLAGCRTKEEKLQAEYLIALRADLLAYAGSDAEAAYKEKQKFIDHVHELAKAGADIPVKDLDVWEYARLALLADHLGRKDQASQYFALAVTNAEKANPESAGKIDERALRAALDQMDTPDKFAWRRK